MIETNLVWSKSIHFYWIGVGENRLRKFETGQVSFLVLLPEHKNWMDVSSSLRQISFEIWDKYIFEIWDKYKQDKLCSQNTRFAWISLLFWDKYILKFETNTFEIWDKYKQEKFCFRMLSQDTGFGWISSLNFFLEHFYRHIFYINTNHTENEALKDWLQTYLKHF